ncbi:MAG: AAA family ATPase [Prevotella sp.]|nr:AAA family ATPase [Prevotella sp.]MDY3252408.1 AAA family ATPase [Prevotella sp.]MDY4628611.1 AAA family ATPase [Prevotella sp.]
MESIELQPLFNNYHRKIARIDLRFKRYLYDQINWSARIISIKGARGVGKTTMLLQHILENYEDIDKTLYASLDDLWFSTHSLIDLVDWADQHGVQRLYLDEVHKYARWKGTLKNIYDSYPDMSIVYTSSSLLIMDNATVDLSRRQTAYTLYGMSFREFLAFENILHYPAIALEDLLQNHVRHAMQIVRNVKMASYFEAYLEHGYYPFYREVGEDFASRLREIVSVVIDSDLPAVENMTFETLQKVKKLVMIISERVPFEPKMSELWTQLVTNNELGLRMLYALDKAQIFALLTSKVKNYKFLYKPDKIFLGNTNLMHVLCPLVNKGNERETLFCCQLQVNNDVKHPLKGDFLVNDKYLFEVGGRKKSFEQIADVPNSFLAVDDTEVGHGNRIPLWLFGFTY